MPQKTWHIIFIYRDNKSPKLLLSPANVSCLLPWVLRNHFPSKIALPLFITFVLIGQIERSWHPKSCLKRFQTYYLTKWATYVFPKVSTTYWLLGNPRSLVGWVLHFIWVVSRWRHLPDQPFKLLIFNSCYNLRKEKLLSQRIISFLDD